MMNNTPIVVVAFNRERSLVRLLASLERANYPSENVELIISIDFALNNHHIVKIANEFSWNHGKKTVIYHEKNLGLRKHILKCGDYSKQYGSVIILEDDLVVSPHFYNYTQSALDFCAQNDKIGGISLYAHQLNVINRQNFSPLEDGYDNWYFQFASSWGQAWSASQWSSFIEWYEKNNGIDHMETVPAYVRRWSEKSWLKYYIAYLVATQKFFFYPRVSLTTNFSDAGTHIGNDSTRFQVPLLIRSNKAYNFSRLEDSSSVYDAFFENSQYQQLLGADYSEVTIDLYGNKTIYSQFLLTTKILDFKILKSYAKSLKPMDANILFDLPGNEIFLYDTKQKVINTSKTNVFRSIIYNHKHITPKNALHVLWDYGKHVGQKVFPFIKFK